jgi:hypothetical protein
VDEVSEVEVAAVAVEASVVEEAAEVVAVASG